MSVTPISFPTDHQPLSGLIALPNAPQPIGTIIALHGGGYRAGYWHCDALPEASLLLLGAQLGYAVLAIDRPGYGSSQGWPSDRQRLGHQVDQVFDVIDESLRRIPALQNKPIFVIGHSMGGILALMMAARRERASVLSGIDVSGVPLRYPPEMQAVLSQQAAAVDKQPYLPERPAGEMQGFFYGPPGTYLPEALQHDAEIHAPVPSPEFLDAANCPVELPPLMKKIELPVQLTIPKFEKSSIGGVDSLAYAKQFLTNSKRVVTWLQQGAGHNISLHKVARAYHLRAIAFFEECRHLS